MTLLFNSYSCFGAKEGLHSVFLCSLKINNLLLNSNLGVEIFINDSLNLNSCSGIE